MSKKITVTAIMSVRVRGRVTVTVGISVKVIPMVNEYQGESGGDYECKGEGEGGREVSVEVTARFTRVSTSANSGVGW